MGWLSGGNSIPTGTFKVGRGGTLKNTKTGRELKSPHDQTTFKKMKAEKAKKDAAAKAKAKRDAAKKK